MSSLCVCAHESRKSCTKNKASCLTGLGAAVLLFLVNTSDASKAFQILSNPIIF